MAVAEVWGNGLAGAEGDLVKMAGLLGLPASLPNILGCPPLNATPPIVLRIISIFFIPLIIPIILILIQQGIHGCNPPKRIERERRSNSNVIAHPPEFTSLE